MREIPGATRRLVWASTALTAIWCLIAVATYRPGHESTLVNRYGQSVEIFGAGLYARESVLRAGIFTGVDAVNLLACPLVLLALRRADRRAWRLVLIALLAGSTYYTLSLAAGSTYYYGALLQYAMLGTTTFAFVGVLLATDRDDLAAHNSWQLPWRALTVFLALGGVALVVAWLPDIVASWGNHATLSMAEVYSTEITYALDMGIVGPMILVTAVELRRRTGLGLVLGASVLVVCVAVAVQSIGGAVLLWPVYRELGVAQVVTKIVVFIVLGVVGGWLLARLLRAQR
ncbi:hypothetical protein AAEX63_11260 [Luteococcus sp. H138]|uniref:hypothetical protein n=1 Tax=unclassified Luteococcus TaxID=2639923 RepID=UPI00313D7D79